jgi:hypothetical protein
MTCERVSQRRLRIPARAPLSSPLSWMASSGASAAPTQAAKEEQARVLRCAATRRAARARARKTRVLTASRRRQTLRVAAAELRSLKPGRAVYAQRGGVFFLVPREAALQDTCVRLAAVARKHE